MVIFVRSFTVLCVIWLSDQYDKMAQEFREMQLNHYQLREKYDDLVEKMKFFTKV